jgi:hypothetical protein
VIVGLPAGFLSGANRVAKSARACAVPYVHDVDDGTPLAEPATSLSRPE